MALHRVTGPQVFAKLLPFFLAPHSRENFSLVFSHRSKPVTRYLLLKNKEGETIDDVLVSFFQAPYSYTGEETIEISAHGNPLITRNIHSLLRQIGMRDAEPGEFTQRAFLNGKLDLTQAEAVNELIHAETENGLRLARSTNEGAVSKAALDLRSELIGALAYLEAHIDFGTDEVGNYAPSSIVPQLEKTLEKLELLSASYTTGLKLREGLKVALGGRPNAGKSSLYNALLKADRAIVTDIAGTTRDVLEDRLLISGHDFVLLDTAGLRESTDIVERIGVSRSRASLASADIVCVMCDLTNSGTVATQDFLQEELNDILRPLVGTEPPAVLLVLSKADLFTEDIRQQAERIAKQLNSSATPSIPAVISDVKPETSLELFAIKVDACVLVSADNCDPLREALVNLYKKLTQSARGDQSAILISTRQRDKVNAALAYLQEAKVGLNNADYPEKVASLLNSSCQSLDLLLE